MSESAGDEMRARAYAKILNAYKDEDFDVLAEVATAAGGLDVPCLTGKRALLHLSAMESGDDRGGMLNRLQERFPIRNPDTPDESGMTPLYIACRNSDPEMISFLLKNGADPDFAFTDPDTGERNSCIGTLSSQRFKTNNPDFVRKIECLREMLKYNPDLGLKDSHIDKTPLGKAIESGLWIQAEMLLEHGGGLYPFRDFVKGHQGKISVQERTPELIFSQGGLDKCRSRKTAELLVSKHPEFLDVFINGTVMGVPFPIHAATSGNHEMVDFLCAHGFSYEGKIISDICKGGSARGSPSDVIRVLHGHGVVGAPDLIQHSPVAWALGPDTKTPDISIIDALLDCGYSFDVPCMRKGTAFEELSKLCKEKNTSVHLRLLAKLESTKLLTQRKPVENRHRGL